MEVATEEGETEVGSTATAESEEVGSTATAESEEVATETRVVEGTVLPEAKREEAEGVVRS